MNIIFLIFSIICMVFACEKLTNMVNYPIGEIVLLVWCAILSAIESIMFRIK